MLKSLAYLYLNEELANSPDSPSVNYDENNMHNFKNSMEDKKSFQENIIN